MADVEKPAATGEKDAVERKSSAEDVSQTEQPVVAKDAEKTGGGATYIPENDEDYVVTWKTWVVVWILAWSYGLSFWIVPSASAASSVIATDLGDVTKSAWYISTYVLLQVAFYAIANRQKDTP